MNVSKVSLSSNFHNHQFAKRNFKGTVANTTAGVGGGLGTAAAIGVIEGAKAAVLGGATVTAGTVAAPVLGLIAAGAGVGWLLGKAVEKLTGK